MSSELRINFGGSGGVKNEEEIPVKLVHVFWFEEWAIIHVSNMFPQFSTRRIEVL